MVPRRLLGILPATAPGCPWRQAAACGTAPAAAAVPALGFLSLSAGVRRTGYDLARPSQTASTLGRGATSASPASTAACSSSGSCPGSAVRKGASKPWSRACTISTSPSPSRTTCRASTQGAWRSPIASFSAMIASPPRPHRRRQPHRCRPHLPTACPRWPGAGRRADRRDHASAGPPSDPRRRPARRGGADLGSGRRVARNAGAARLTSTLAWDADNKALDEAGVAISYRRDPRRLFNLGYRRPPARRYRSNRLVLPLALGATLESLRSMEP